MNTQAKNVVCVFSVKALRMFSFIIDDAYCSDVVNNIARLSVEHIIAAIISPVPTNIMCQHYLFERQIINTTKNSNELISR